MKKIIRAWRRRQQRRKRPDVQVTRGYAKFLRNEPRGPLAIEGPRISVILPVYNTPPAFLRAAINSVKKQTYRNWELCIADDASPTPYVALLVADLAGTERRIKRLRLTKNQGISTATNEALTLATGDYVAFLDHDDILPPYALARVAAELTAFPDTDMLFSDEDQLVNGKRARPYFKPGWNPDLFNAQNLVSHLGVYRHAIVKQLGGMRREFAGSQDYDLALRVAAATTPDRIRHIPEILYHWRQHQGAFSARRAMQCRNAARAAVGAAVVSHAVAEANPDLPQYIRVIYPLPRTPTRISLIMPQGAVPPATEVLLPAEPWTSNPAEAPGDVLVFLPAGVTPARPGWLVELVGQALRPDVACAGPLLLRPDGGVAHSGYFLDPDHIAQTLAPGSDPEDPGYFGHFLLCRTVSAVAREGLTIRRDLFAELGGFDSRAGAYADIDLCLRATERGLRTVFAPYARLICGSPVPPASDKLARAYMRERWLPKLSRDPYLNPNLVVQDGNLALAPMTRQRQA
jgi:GT2 family glycosyltransferase